MLKEIALSVHIDQKRQLATALSADARAVNERDPLTMYSMLLWDGKKGQMTIYHARLP